MEEIGISLTDIIRPGTKRGLDFVVVDELRKRTGINPDSVLKFALGEMLCNSLDTDATEIKIGIGIEGKFCCLEIQDNGTKKLSLEDIKLILDFESKASSKRGFLMASRGYLGNALKCIFGYSYALTDLSGLAPPDIIVRSGSLEYRITLKPNRVKEVIESDIATMERQDDGFTTFIVKFPIGVVAERSALVLKDLIFATSMVNPNRKISYNLFDIERNTLGSDQGSKPLKNMTSVLWYGPRQFQALYEDFVRATPETKLKDFIALFRGFTAKKKIGEILHELNALNHDLRGDNSMQFFPATPIKDLSRQMVEWLYVIMKAMAKPIPKNKRSVRMALGCVGEEELETLRKRQGWKRLRYVLMPSIRVECPEWNHTKNPCRNMNHVEFPYLVELAVFDRKEDGEGLKVYQCVNFMASMEDIFARIFNIPYRLGRVGIKQETPVTVMPHLICPVLKWLNYGKSALDEGEAQPDGVVCGEGDSIRSVMEQAFDKILPIPKTPRVYQPPPPPKPMTWIPHGKLGNQLYEMRLRDFAQEIKAIDSQRTKPVKYSSRGWCYLLEGLGKIHKGEFDATQKTINDCRKIGLLPIDFVAEDQDETRRFKGIIDASTPSKSLSQVKSSVKSLLNNLPTHITDFWKGEHYYVMMCVEKGDIKRLFLPICKEYHVPIVSSKGWPPILLRAHIANLCKRVEGNLTGALSPVLLLFYDHDPAGLKITRRFKKMLWDCARGTSWIPANLIIDRFGLNKEDIDAYNLTWIENVRTSSGRESRDYDYIRTFGRRKCESNALFKNDETLRAAEEICRKAIEKYYGEDARERFKEKEGATKQKLKDVYEDPLWENFFERIDELIDSVTVEEEGKEEPIPEAEKEVEVRLLLKKEDGKLYKYYGECPRCGRYFNYDHEKDVGKLVRCRYCSLPMRLRGVEA